MTILEAQDVCRASLMALTATDASILIDRNHIHEDPSSLCYSLSFDPYGYIKCAFSHKDAFTYIALIAFHHEQPPYGKYPSLIVVSIQPIANVSTCSEHSLAGRLITA